MWKRTNGSGAIISTELGKQRKRERERTIGEKFTQFERVKNGDREKDRHR